MNDLHLKFGICRRFGRYGRIRRRHFSHFLTSGAVRIGISKYTETIEATAFQTDEQITVVLLNRTTEPLDLYLRIQNVCAPLTLPPQSIATGVVSLD